MAKGRAARFGAATAVAATAILAVAGLVLASQGVLTYLDREEAPQTPQTVTTVITTGQLTDTVTGDVRVEPGQVWSIDREGIVTREGLAAGQQAEEGDVVVVVNERPTILLQGEVPVYRSLGVGTEGNDVRQLQAALNRLGYEVREDGEFGYSTARAVFALYSDRGFAPVDSEGAVLESWQTWLAEIPQVELTFAKSVPVEAVGACGTVGQRVTGAVCEVMAGAGQVVISIAKSETSRASAGMPVRLSLGGEDLEGSLGAAWSPTNSSDEGDSDGESNSGGSSIVDFAVTLDSPLGVPPGTTGSGRIIVAASAQEARIVEAVAIREDEGGELWLLVDDGTRLEVAVGLCVRGQCEISGSGVRESLVIELPSPTPVDTGVE